MKTSLALPREYLAPLKTLGLSTTVMAFTKVLHCITCWFDLHWDLKPDIPACSGQKMHLKKKKKGVCSPWSSYAFRLQLKYPTSDTDRPNKGVPQTECGLEDQIFWSCWKRLLRNFYLMPNSAQSWRQSSIFVPPSEMFACFFELKFYSKKSSDNRDETRGAQCEAWWARR